MRQQTTSVRCDTDASFAKPRLRRGWNPLRERHPTRLAVPVRTADLDQARLAPAGRMSRRELLRMSATADQWRKLSCAPNCDAAGRHRPPRRVDPCRPLQLRVFPPTSCVPYDRFLQVARICGQVRSAASNAPDQVARQVQAACSPRTLRLIHAGPVRFRPGLYLFRDGLLGCCQRLLHDRVDEGRLGDVATLGFFGEPGAHLGRKIKGKRHHGGQYSPCRRGCQAGAGVAGLEFGSVRLGPQVHHPDRFHATGADLVELADAVRLLGQVAIELVQPAAPVTHVGV